MSFRATDLGILHYQPLRMAYRNKASYKSISLQVTIQVIRPMRERHIISS